jgi:two-component system, OmpR family, Ni(II)-sensor and/or redox sensor kinase NrsS
MNSQQLFRRSRLRLALWYAIAMGLILSLSGLGMYRALVQANWKAIEREMESIAGTLHDSLEPMLPEVQNPTVVLQRILPELCAVGQSCGGSPSLIQRHTTGISDRSTYYLRLLDHHGNLLAFSPTQPADLPSTPPTESWHTLEIAGKRYRQFTIILHSAEAKHVGNQNHPHASWGYLQLGRTLESFDTEVLRIRWILAIGVPLALALIAISSWGLSGLAMQPIYQSYQQQQQFTANVAHELRSPLASLLATVEAVLRLPPSSPQDIPPMLQTVERQGRRLSHLITDLLLLSSLEHGASAQPWEACCLNDLVSDLTEEFLELAAIEAIDLTQQIPDQAIYVSGDAAQLYRLVSNIIANAIKYTLKGGYIVVSLRIQDRTALIEVKDTGIGIPLADQRRIFDRFYRVNSDRSRQTGGTGLGLAIAQAIVQRHHGNITVKSEGGSIFTIHLPILRPPKKAHSAHGAGD